MINVSHAQHRLDRVVREIRMDKINLNIAVGGGDKDRAEWYRNNVAKLQEEQKELTRLINFRCTRSNLGLRESAHSGAQFAVFVRQLVQVEVWIICHEGQRSCCRGLRTTGMNGR